MASAQELALASEMNFRKAGKENAAKLIHEVALTSPTRLSKIRRALQTLKVQLRNHTPEEALSLFIETNSSMGRYQLLKNSARHCNALNFYPTYRIIAEEMDKCIPDRVVVSESLAEVPLQLLLDHSAKRLVLL
ncbi:hypothetical protein FOCC_FOCC013715 [Frankliniella occidentalis]|nr:hypothetical protein FOCC_FOCC013715 [Frankliniella occidentalis]